MTVACDNCGAWMECPSCGNKIPDAPGPQHTAEECAKLAEMEADKLHQWGAGEWACRRVAAVIRKAYWGKG